MAIHKTRYRPPVYVNGEATYPDIVYFETSADMVKVTDEDELYDATDVEAALAEVKTELDEHKLDYMPHRIQDLKNNKIYKYSLQMSEDGQPQIKFEEVI